MTERQETLKLAERLLDGPNVDPDDDLRMLSRQLLRGQETIDRLKKDLMEAQDPMGDLIQFNRDSILKMHEEAIERLRICLEGVVGGIPTDGPAYRAGKLGLEIIRVLGLFHPMHGESWPGWPDMTIN